MIQYNDQLSARETILMEKEAESNRLYREHDLVTRRLEAETRIKAKELDLQLSMHQVSLRRIPLLILQLPLTPFIGIALCILAAKGQLEQTKLQRWFS